MAINTFRNRPGHYEFPQGTSMSNSGSLQDITGAVFVPDDDAEHPIPVMIRRSITGATPRMEVISQAPGANPREEFDTIEQGDFDQLRAAANAAIIERLRTANRPPVAAADGQYLFGPDTREVQGASPDHRQVRNVLFQPSGGGAPQLVTLTVEPGASGPVYKRVDANNPSNNPTTIDAAAYNGVQTAAATAQSAPAPAATLPGHGTPEHPNWESTGVPLPEGRSTREMFRQALIERGITDPQQQEEAIRQIQRRLVERAQQASRTIDLGPFGTQNGQAYDGVDGKVGPFTTAAVKADRGITGRSLTQADVTATVNDCLGDAPQVQPVTPGLNVEAAAQGQDANTIAGVTYTPQGGQLVQGEIRRTGTEGNYTYAFHPAQGNDVPLQAQDWQAAQASIAARQRQSQISPAIDSNAATFGENGVIENVTYNVPGQEGAAPTAVQGSLVRVTEGGTTRYEFRPTNGSQAYPATQGDYQTAASNASQRDIAARSTNRFLSNVGFAISGQAIYLDGNGDEKITWQDMDGNGDGQVTQYELNHYKDLLQWGGVDLSGLNVTVSGDGHEAASQLANRAIQKVEEGHRGQS